ncbi:hypothetical protein L596_010723 [Steinernema carpocapsae]|uniref:Histone-lysine N-methyltransferase n=1 Tax=Steinernema carpocapsae TaxID=34508 RepID=A0A4V6A6Z1_STECR|nr:hypothetical protein L596_010723 [Steinernema carpocapsae]
MADVPTAVASVPVRTLVRKIKDKNLYPILKVQVKELLQTAGKKVVSPLLDLTKMMEVLDLVNKKEPREVYLYGPPPEESMDDDFVMEFKEFQCDFIKQPVTKCPETIFKLRMRKQFPGVWKAGKPPVRTENWETSAPTAAPSSPQTSTRRAPAVHSRDPKNIPEVNHDNAYKVERVVHAFQDHDKTYYYVKWRRFPLELKPYLADELKNMCIIEDYEVRQKVVDLIYKRLGKKRPYRSKKYFSSTEFKTLQSFEWSANYVCLMFKQGKLYVENWESDKNSRKFRTFEFTLESTFSKGATEILHTAQADHPHKRCICTDCGKASSSNDVGVTSPSTSEDRNLCCRQNHSTHNEKVFYTDKGLLHGKVLKNGTWIIECSSICKCYGGFCPNKIVQQGRQIPVMLFWTELKGWGLYAVEQIKKGTFISEYVGHVMTEEECKDLNYMYHFELCGERQLIMDARFRGNESRFVNHCCDPNSAAFVVFADFDGGDYHRHAFFAIKDIEPGEEITIDYFANEESVKRINAYKAEKLKNKDKIPESRKCHCGAEKCRGVFSAGDYETNKERKKRKAQEKAMKKNDANST